MFQVFRSGVLILVLILLPAVAVCWNMIPKNIFWKEKVNSVVQNDKNDPSGYVQIDQLDTNDSDSVWLKSSIPLNADPLLNDALSGNADILSSGGVRDQNSFGGDSDIVRFIPMTPLKPQENSVSNRMLGDNTNRLKRQRDFAEIVAELQNLGATYYCLEKWGNQGELFRFRCYVNPNGVPNNGSQQNSYKYQKFFQHIDNDQIRVMEHVIDEIKMWKNM
ncbi:MAG: hypothetical protein LBE18_06475 [Planctomycetaceae bacterium]|jgi:hypothetical protein|nr:hypothetical protein [Planctomycetaceae bacterium]